MSKSNILQFEKIEAEADTEKDVSNAGPLNAQMIQDMHSMLKELKNNGRTISLAQTVLLKDIDETLSFKEPFAVSIENIQDQYTVQFYDLNLYGSGDTEYEALAMLKREISSLYHDIADLDDNELGTHPKKWKQFFKRNLQIRN